ncbi:COP9 signalosome [Cerioporus squamosus]|nr:COP9 signalosome [Cerioporus squamosus]
MTGPPTPPPSSATEIEDAARTTLPPPQAAPAAVEPATAPVPAQTATEQPQPPITNASTQKSEYELLFPSITELARSGSIRDLIEVAERGDQSADQDRNPARLLLVAPLVLAYLVVDDIPPARHALTRLPATLTSLPLVQGLFSLLSSVSERKYANIYTRAEQLHQFVLDPSFSVEPLGQVLAGMITGFVDTFRKKTFHLLARAYTSIPLPLAQVYLGLTAEQVVNVAVPAGWEFHETSFILTPHKQPSGSRSVTSAPSTLLALNLVAETVANLES